MLRADLHMHSVYSDGTLTIKKLLDYAKSNIIGEESFISNETIYYLKNYLYKNQKECYQVLQMKQMYSHILQE